LVEEIPSYFHSLDLNCPIGCLVSICSDMR